MSTTMMRSTKLGLHSLPLRRIVSGVLVATFALAWWSFLRPATLGGPLTFITVTGSSMEPGLHTGDLALVFERDRYSVGDVVAFRHQTEDGTTGSHVIHRIKGGDATRGFVMRGDNNSWDDPWEPTGDQIAGKMLFSVPDVGHAVTWVAQPFHFAALLSSLFVMVVLAGGSRTKNPEENGPSHA